MAKPSTLPEWDTTGVNAIEPDATHKAEGWIAPGGVPEKPPFQTFNHWMNAVWKWIKEFAQQGIVEWDGTTTYQIDDIAKGSDGLLYRSLIGANTNNDPLTNLDKWIDIQWRNQTVPITFPSDADYTLTDDQNAYGRILISGAVISTARNLIVNNIQKTLIVQNDEAFDVTVKTAAGTGIVVFAGSFKIIYNDGTNILSIENRHVLQSITAELAADFATASTTFVDMLTTTITPRSSTSKLYITISSGRKNVSMAGTSNGAEVAIFKDATELNRYRIGSAAYQSQEPYSYFSKTDSVDLTTKTIKLSARSPGGGSAIFNDYDLSGSGDGKLYLIIQEIEEV